MTVVEDNVALRSVEIANLCDGEIRMTQWLTERKGGNWEFWLAPPCIIVFHGVWSLSCYRDDEIGPPDLSTCIPNLPIGVPEQTSRSGFSPYPNPGTINFTLSLPPGPHTITLFDATGRMVLEQRTTEERPVIGTEHLPSGLYRIVVRDEQGGVMGATWVKER